MPPPLVPFCFISNSYYMKIKGTVYVELALYLGLGLSVLLVWDAVLEQMHHGELLLIAGGLVRDEAIFEGVFLVFFVPCVVVRHLPFLAVSVVVFIFAVSWSLIVCALA